jgi:3-hydroxyacyl-[acyl-carrier-protein] dehydratase
MTNATDLHAILPWQHPFRMVDKLTECVPHERIVTLKRVTTDEPTGPGSFPSSLVLEGLSQTAALLFRLSYGAEALGGTPLLGSLNASLEGGAEPGDTIEYAVRAVKMTSTHGLFTGTATVNGAQIARAELAFAMGRP